jgi:peptidoglycan/LPS O-acetylase OafA/YrhL
LKRSVAVSETENLEEQVSTVETIDACHGLSDGLEPSGLDSLANRRADSVFRRPEWLSTHIPELDGLRGIAILWVVLYHCHDKVVGTSLFAIAQWGWAGVNLFFVLSGFLITGILLDSRSKDRSAGQFFRDFYARRLLRIWPVYVLVLFLVYVGVPLIFGAPWLSAVKSAPWLRYAFFIQNLSMVPLPGTLGPTWSLAIEEQYYLLWAPVARWFRPRVLFVLLLAVVVASPFLRIGLSGAVSRTHTLIHLDGIALGSLMALLLRITPVTQSTWKKIAPCIVVVGSAALFYASHRFPASLDSAFALLFSGILLAAVAFSGTRGVFTSPWRLRLFGFYGRISYGLYMIHILVFALLGNIDLVLERHGMNGNLEIVAIRFLASTAAATALWYGFEKPILRLKRYFA